MGKTEDKFEIPKGVTIDNALRYVVAIEEAVKRDIVKLPEDMRTFALASMKMALELAAHRVERLLDEARMTKELTDEEKFQLSMLMAKEEGSDKKKS